MEVVMSNSLERRPSRVPYGKSLTKPDLGLGKKSRATDLLERGFQLAYFILPDRLAAVEILVGALEKLRVQSRRESKRLYWRDKHSDHPVRRMIRNDEDMLQWLIMFEAERYERAQEHLGKASLRSMVTWYIKHLVQVTTVLSSFYVNIGLTRLLRSYSTSDTQRAYEMLTGRFLGADEYRRAKAVLIDKMSHRFADLVNLTKVDRGHLRFETAHDQEPWAGLVDDCLKAFSPWSTEAVCSWFSAVNGGDDNLTSMAGPGDGDRNELETRWCHIFIEPVCYSRLMEQLNLEPPGTKLALPRFAMPEKNNKNQDNGRQPGCPPHLSDEDMEQIDRRLAATDTRRRNLNPRFVTVVIDNEERTRLDLTEKRRWQVEMKAGDCLIEIRGEDDGGQLVLATHLISYVNNNFEFSKAIAMFKRARLKLQVTPGATQAQRPQCATLDLDYRPTHINTRFSIEWPELMKLRGRVRSYALAGLTVVLVAWAVAGAFYAHRVSLLERQLHQAHRNPQQLSPTAARAVVSYALIPDERRLRGAESAGIPEISLQLQASAVSLELPISRTAKSGYSAELKTFAGDRTLMIQNFLQPSQKDTGWAVEIVIPADLLQPDVYYTVHLHTPDGTDHFTFKAVAGQ
jgi:hypothetical protein